MRLNSFLNTLQSLIVVFLIISFQGFSQESQKIIPPSPNAAALGKYGDVPVSLYTGIPNISVPIWNFQGRQLSLPISLSYHAGGVRVEENASWIGLGWALNAGGVITRSVRGNPDERGYLAEAAIPSTPTNLNFFDDVKIKLRDPEPDAFFFNFNGYSGKFIFEKNAAHPAPIKAHIIPYQDIEITFHYSDYPNNNTKFIVKTENGTQYIFGENQHKEQTTINSYFYNLLNDGSDPFDDDISYATTSWYLTKIVAPNGTDEINFTYTDEVYEYETAHRGKRGYHRSNTNMGLEFSTKNYSKHRIDGKRLTNIHSTSSGVSIEFKADKIRNDLKSIQNLPAPKSLTKIIIKDKDGIAFKHFDLDTDYFRNSKLDDPSTFPPIGLEREYLYQRVRLNKITEFASSTNVSKPAYIFTYDTSTELPPKDAHLQDHWGFYNGPAVAFSNGSYYNNYFMIPAFQGAVDNSGEGFSYVCGNNQPVSIPVNDFAYFTIPGVNREPAFPSMQAGILTKIQYPTGGTTDLTYEAHTYGYVGSEEYTKTIFNQVYPSANIERPFDSSDGDDPFGNEIEQYYPITVAEDQIVKISFQIEFAYESEEKFNKRLSFTRYNEVSLTKDGLSNPIVKVFYDGVSDYDPSDPERNNIWIATYNEETGQYLPYIPVLRNLSNYESEETGIGSNQGYARIQINGSVVVKLKAGSTYRLQAKREYFIQNSECGCLSNNNAALISFDDPIDSDTDPDIITSHMAGGLRVKIKTDTSDPSSLPIVTNYGYTMHNLDGKERTGNLQRSSGSIVTLPQHFSSKYHENASGGPSCNDCGLFSIAGCTSESVQVYLVFEANSDYPSPLSSTQGSHIGYQYVKVWQENNGYTLYNYSSPFDIPDVLPSQIYQTINNSDFAAYNVNTETIAPHIFPFLPAHSDDWQRGLLRKTYVFDKQGIIRKYDENNYTLSTNRRKIIEGVSVIFSGIEQRTLTLGRWVDYCKYYIISDFPFLNSTESTFYNADGVISVKTKKQYEYSGNNHAQLTKTIEETSNSDKLIITEFTYPSDYTSVISGPLYQMRTDKHMINSVIESVVKEKEGTNERVIKGSYTVYEDVDNNSNTSILLPTTHKVLELTKPIDDFSSSKNSTLDTRFKDKEYFKYNATSGNVESITRKSDVSTIYLWGYNNMYPVAEIKNAAYTDVKAALGLDEDDEIDLGSAGLDQDQITALKNNLGDAMITTFTYDPIKGMTSQTDPSGVITKFEYDAFGRLKLLKDHEDNIVKQFIYHYKPSE